MVKILRFSALLLLALSIGGCSLEDEEQNFHFVTLSIVEAQMPESFELNETYTINLTYIRNNSCTFFEGFRVEEPDTNTRDIIAVGTEFTDEPCTEATEMGTATFNFTVLNEGTYTFRFFHDFDVNEEPVYIEYQIEVTPDN